MMYLIFILFGTAISQDFSCPSGYIGSNSNALNSGANDVIVVTQKDGSLKSTRISVQVGKFHNFWSTVWSREGTEMKIYVNGQKAQCLKTTQKSLIFEFSSQNYRMSQQVLAKSLNLPKTKTNAKVCLRF